MKKSLKELLEQLNSIDENDNVEAKKASEVGKSLMETVCSFSNEPNLGGGYILMGVEKENSLFPSYVVSGIPQDQLDKIQTTFSSQCGDLFNIPIRPKLYTEEVEGSYAVIAYIPELSPEQKPLFFKNRGLPSGAYRRIGSADHKCTEDDLILFYNNTDTLDKSIIVDADINDISEEAIEYYKKLRKNVNPAAEELSYTNTELLEALSALRKNKKELKVTYTGLLCFGSRQAQRKLLPMTRIDYIRVSTNHWVDDPNNRFESIVEMRGSILEIAQRIVTTISDDLPKGFLLNDDNIQAQNIGLPIRVLREAVVNALIHRSYRENSPIQIIRYPNRIEIINPGFSLKSDEYLGEPGSVNRNPNISAIFHETNLAETKGSGIRTMRRLMEEVEMMPPTFESNREKNKFTVRLLLHHLLNEKDISWLNKFKNFDLNDNQKRILIFVKEVFAIDNSAARQINGSDPTITSNDLKKLKDLDLIEQKGKTKYTYYIPTELLKSMLPDDEIYFTTQADGLTTQADGLTTQADGLTTQANELTTQANELTTHGGILQNVPKDIMKDIEKIGKRVNNPEVINSLILRLCKWKPLKREEISAILDRNDKHIYRQHIKPLFDNKLLIFTIPDMPKHPEQAYKTNENLENPS